MLNQVTIQGRFTADPVVKDVPGGRVLNFCVACERERKGSQEEKQTDFITCIAWNRAAEFIGDRFEKGSRILLGGRLQSRNFTDQAGGKHTAQEVLVEKIYFD